MSEKAARELAGASVLTSKKRAGLEQWRFCPEHQTKDMVLGKRSDLRRNSTTIRQWDLCTVSKIKACGGFGKMATDRLILSPKREGMDMVTMTKQRTKQKKVVQLNF